MSDDLTINIDGTPVTANMDEWARVQAQIIDRRVEVQRAWEAARRAAGEVWEADLCSCGFGGGDNTEEFFTLDDAVEMLSYIEENSDSSIREIRDPSGRKVTINELKARASA